MKMMRTILLFGFTFILWVGPLSAVGAAPTGPPVRQLSVHLVQANNQSPYCLVRAKFEPGELADPWAVRFFDDQGAEVQYFVWDVVTWRVAREGREDWGHRYALLNHAAGDGPETIAARQEKINAAKKGLPELGARLEAQEEAAKKHGDSICAAMYLVRRTVPAMGKDRLTMRIYPQRQIEPRLREIKSDKVQDRTAIDQGALRVSGLPDQLSVAWKGKEICRSAGFEAGGTSGTTSHADPARPFRIEVTEGIVTKVSLQGQTAWRQNGAMDWQCTYWLFPEGSYVALEGFSLSDPGQYLGGAQKLSVLGAGDGAAFVEAHTPDWDKPWWIHRAGDRGFVATHVFFATPLAVGYGNNPFTVNAEGPNKEPRVELDNGKLALRWFHEANDPVITRLSSRQPITIRNGHIAGADNPPAESKPAWRPKTDWLYRQHIVGVGEKPEQAETALRSVLGAAAGWIDRPVNEEEMASLLVSQMRSIGVDGQSAEIGLLKIVPAVMSNDRGAIQKTLQDRLVDPIARTDQYIAAMRQNAANGGHPAAGSKLLPNGTRVEGWTGNPCYHAALMPTHVRVVDFFEQTPAAQRDRWREAIVRYADFGLELLGGSPFDAEKFRKALESQWPSRVVPTIPLMLIANAIKPDEKYISAAKLLFDDLYRLVERNPHGYFPAWTFTPGADKYDTVYNPVSYDRGINSIWFEEAQDKIGRGTTSGFVAAQARWMVYSGQLSDTLETDNVTAIRACNHGGHTNLRNQIGLYLYDDFAFYRGLLGDLISWSAASDLVRETQTRKEGDPPRDPRLARYDRSGTGPYRGLILSNAGSSMVRWGLNIRPDNKWLESRVQPLADKKGFRLLAWKRLPDAKPTIKVNAKEAGLPGDAILLEVQLSGPAYRQPAEIEMVREGDRLVLTNSKPVKISVNVQAMCRDWPADAQPTLSIRRSGQDAQPISEGAVRDKGTLTWQAGPGVYELSRTRDGTR